MGTNIHQEPFDIYPGEKFSFSKHFPWVELNEDLLNFTRAYNLKFNTNYNFREEHAERDGKVYLLRGCWALEQGLIKAGPAGYADEITQPAEEPFCRCYFTYIYHLRSVPKDMLTSKGETALADAKAKVAAFS